MPILHLNDIKKALVIGPFYDQLNIINKAVEMTEKYDVVILNGGLCYTTDKFKINSSIKLVSEAISTGKVIYNISGADYKLAIDNEEVEAFLKGKPNIVYLKFVRGAPTAIVDGGITNEILKMVDLYDNLELSFVNNEKWHKNYNDRFGYIISNKPLSQNEPTFYNYSARIGTPYGANKVYAQEVLEYSLGKTFLV